MMKKLEQIDEEEEEQDLAALEIRARSTATLSMTTTLSPALIVNGDVLQHWWLIEVLPPSALSLLGVDPFGVGT